MSFKTIFGIVLGILFTVFVVQNTQVVEVTFFFKQVSMSRSILLISTLLMGFILGWIVAKLMGRRK
jgi:uncharacterized integral membrane protein